MIEMVMKETVTIKPSPTNPKKPYYGLLQILTGCDPCRKGDHEHCITPLKLCGDWKECCCSKKAWREEKE